MKRSGFLSRSTKLRPVNPERQARVKRQRARQRNSKAERAARAEAWVRASGICECGCGRPFDQSGSQYDPGYPEFHHQDYDPPVGQYLRRECHARIEMTQFSYRNPRRFLK